MAATTCHLCPSIRNLTVYPLHRVFRREAPSPPPGLNLESAIREKSLLEVSLPTSMKVSNVDKETRLDESFGCL